MVLRILRLFKLYQDDSISERFRDYVNSEIKKYKLDFSTMCFPTRNQFHETCLPQVFPIPMTMMKYIWSNPSSPKIYGKLIKTCKLFFIKNSILVFTNLKYTLFWCSWQYCTKKVCRPGCICEKEYIKMNHPIVQNIWISKKLRISDHTKPNQASSIIPKIKRYTVKELSLGEQHLSYNELRFLAFGIEKCVLFSNIIKYDSGKAVPLENIIKLFSGAKKVYMDFEKNSDNAVCKSYEDFITACNTVNEVEMCRIPDVFDVPTFYQHLKRSKNRCLIEIFSSSNRHALLEEIIDEILATESFEFVPPVIKYRQNNEFWNYNKDYRMSEIRRKVAAKYH